MIGLYKINQIMHFNHKKYSLKLKQLINLHNNKEQNNKNKNLVRQNRKTNKYTNKNNNNHKHK